jgi:hypothetical protein
MIPEETIYAFRVHNILLDIFGKLVCQAIEDKISLNGSIDEFLCQSNPDGEINFLDKHYLKSAKKNFFEKLTPRNFPNDLTVLNLDQNEINKFNRIFPLFSRSTSVSGFICEKINEIDSKREIKSIRNKIFKHVCPKSLNEFDISANIAIFQNYFPGSTPTNGWKDELDMYDETLPGCLNNIRWIRNHCYGHLEHYFIGKNDYDERIKNFKKLKSKNHCSSKTSRKKP